MPLLTSESVESVVIAGAGGFGLEVYDYLQKDAAHGGPPIAGFIDDTPGLVLGSDLKSPLLGTIDGYVPKSGQVVVVAIGLVKGRQFVLQKLWSRGVRTPSLLAEMTVISPGAAIEHGVIICPFSIVGRRARLGAGSMLNVHCSIGHGASVGEFSILCPFTALNGDSSIGARCFLGTRATIYPKTHIGADCVVDTHCGVRQSVPAGKVMISNRGHYQATPLR